MSTSLKPRDDSGDNLEVAAWSAASDNLPTSTGCKFVKLFLVAFSLIKNHCRLTKSEYT